METLDLLVHGFAVSLQPINLLACFLGVLVGTLVGVLPGIGPISAMSILMPATLSGTPEAGIIMMAGIYYGAMYGGSTTSILVNIPGEAASIVTCLDGHEMAKRGRAGPALGIAALGSFIAGTIAVVLLMLVAPAFSRLALAFGPSENFSLMVLGLAMLTFLTQGSLAKAILMACAGLVLGLVGLDNATGLPRLTYGNMYLADGIGVLPLAMGLFGVAEVLFNIERPLNRKILAAKVGSLLPGRADWKRSAGPIGRGTLLGFLLGIIPGGGALLASFASYALEKRVSKTPEEFGKGAIEGVAGPEAANNAAAGGAFIPLLTLGIPSNAVMALLLGAFIMHGVQPGPLMMTQRPDLLWGVVASMYIGNLLLLVLNLPLIGMWVKLLQVPYNVLFPAILLFSIVGVYASGNNVFDIYVMIFFGIFGYVLRKLEFEPAPLVLAFVLGPMMESNLRSALIISEGNAMTFLQKPISATCLLLAALLLLGPMLPWLQKRRAAVAFDSETN